jgi:hypothetical protein
VTSVLCRNGALSGQPCIGNMLHQLASARHHLARLPRRALLCLHRRRRQRRRSRAAQRIAALRCACADTRVADMLLIMSDHSHARAPPRKQVAMSGGLRARVVGARLQPPQRRQHAQTPGRPDAPKPYRARARDDPERRWRTRAQRETQRTRRGVATPTRERSQQRRVARADAPEEATGTPGPGTSRTGDPRRRRAVRPTAEKSQAPSRQSEPRWGRRAETRAVPLLGASGPYDWILSEGGREH